MAFTFKDVRLFFRFWASIPRAARIMRRQWKLAVTGGVDPYTLSLCVGIKIWDSRGERDDAVRQGRAIPSSKPGISQETLDRMWAFMHQDDSNTGSQGVSNVAIAWVEEKKEDTPQ